MDCRYEEGYDHLYEIMNKLIKEFFPDLEKAYIKILLDTKKKVYKGKITFGRISTTNDLTRFLTQEDVASGFGYDYIMYLDKLMVDTIEEKDLVRVIRHELRHCIYDPDKKKPWGVIPHDIEDFVAEIRLNMDDMEWSRRLAGKLELMHEQQKDMENN